LKNKDCLNTEYEEIIHRFFIRKATEKEITWLRAWIKETPANLEYFGYFRIIYQTLSDLSQYNEYEAWKEIKAKLPKINKKEATRSIQFKNTIKIAAAVLIVFLASFLLISISRNNHTTLHSGIAVFKVPLGSKSMVILPDSSKVWLNSGSTLSYSFEKNKSLREVYLEGEGFFDIKKDPKKPFLVKTSGVTVKVLGTAFNVKAYPDEKTIETTVERGVVQVTPNISKNLINSKILIYPHQKAIFNRQQNMQFDFSGWYCFRFRFEYQLKRYRIH
jgi:transmembrane sensor